MHTHMPTTPEPGKEQISLPVSPDALTQAVPAAAPSVAPHTAPFYDVSVDEEPDEEADVGMSAPFVLPFQSSAMPVVQQGQEASALSGPLAPPARKQQGGVLRFLRLAIIAAVVIFTVGFLWITVFAQPMHPIVLSMKSAVPMSPGNPTVASNPAMPSAATQPPAKPSQPSPTSIAGSGAPASPANNPQGASWVPQQLPAGWSAAGLSGGDALEAIRTAWTFTDREEGLDFRNVGTRAHHGGTFTASVFILTPGGKMRFQHNDVREINNVLFDHVQAVQLIQAAVNAVPRLVQFQTQGQQQFAWVTISYQLYQSQLDGTTGQRTEGLVMDQATAQPRIYQMSVLLVRVKPGTQGTNAPMGGTGWLVSDYGLNVPSQLMVIQPV